MLAVTAMTGSVKPPQLGQVVGKLGKVAEDEANVLRSLGFVSDTVAFP